jgi:hypothetical protein
MKVLLWSTGIFASSFLLHILIWKIRLPHRQTKALLILFMGALAVAMTGLFYSSRFVPAAAEYVPVGISEYIQIALFHVSLTLAYIITYSSLEADSPSLVIVKAVADAGPEGLDKEVLDEMFTDDILVRPRVNDLIRDKLALVKEGKYRLTPKGRSFIRIFILYRKLLNAPLKGG